MAEQPELDLPAPAPPPPPRRRRTVFAGFTRLQMLVGVIALAALVWGMWVTKALVTPKQEHIVSARLSSLVGEYVPAQARSASPPEQVEAEMRKFMASLDTELQRRSAGGEIVLVGEAVLTKNVPDITDKLKEAGAGYAVPTRETTLEVSGMTCGSCVGRIEKALRAVPGVGEVSIGHALIADALEAGYAATVVDYNHCIARAYA